MTDQEWNPGLLMKVSGSYWQTCALHTGVKLDLFTLLDDRALTAETLAEKAALNAEALKRLLDALAAMRLLKKDGDTYRNAQAAARFLSKKSRQYTGYLIKHHHALMDSWVRMAESIATGNPNRKRASFTEEDRESFLMGMFNTGMFTAPLVAEALDLGGRKALLDIGGGPGTFAIHFCRRNPELNATVYDLPTTRPFAERTIAAFDLSDRITFEPGDYVEGTLAGRYDVAWLSHILHAEGPETCLVLLKKAAAVLAPGGMAAIHEFILDDTMDGPLFPALFSINMLLGTAAGRSYSQSQLTDMMRKAGFKDVARLPYKGPNDAGIVVGIK